MEHDAGNERRWRLKNFLSDSQNLRYSLNTMVPVIVFLTSVFSAVISLQVIDRYKMGGIWIFTVAIFSALCSFLVVYAITKPIMNLIKKVEKSIRFKDIRKEKGQMIEMYRSIEKLIELARLGDLEDEDEKKKIEREIERLDYIVPLGYMSLMVAHEVRNPLSTITGMSELLRERLEGGQTAAYVDAILEAARKIDIFTRELLDLTEADAIHEEFDINQVIRELLDAFSGQFSNVKYDFSGDEDIIILKGDRTKLYQALHNIMRNAFEYEKDGGYVRVDVIKKDKFVTISIYNRSSRIPQEEAEAIFKPFFTKKKGGKGLGLFISLRNIRMHGGDLLVESDNRGTTFTVILPDKKNESGS